jgi:hypothetical protein
LRYIISANYQHASAYGVHVKSTHLASRDELREFSDLPDAVGKLAARMRPAATGPIDASRRRFMV